MNPVEKTIILWVIFASLLVFLPPIVLGILRKTKATLQNRMGASIFQPLYDLRKLLLKGETISELASWVFRNTAIVNFATILTIALLVPWLSFKPKLEGADLFLIIYLLGLARFFTVLAALDAGSVFGGFGASREVTLALLVEPAVMLCLSSLGSVAHTSDLNEIFSFANVSLEHQYALWLLAGSGLFLSSLVELSRMPIDDPTTHLELTMVHEAMILENSGRNLALVEYAHYLKVTILLAISGQCFLHAIPQVSHLNFYLQSLASVSALFLCVFVVAFIESTTVKLRWNKLPEFIAYSVAFSLFCLFIAIIRG